MSYYDILLAKQLSGGGGDITVESLSVTANGTYSAPSGKAYSPVVANVPNTYTASDEGKVVSNGALVAQTSQTIDTNGTYDTTLKNSVTVNVSGGGGGYNLVTSKEITVSIGTSTTATSIDSISVAKSAFTDKLMLVVIRDKNGPQASHFYASFAVKPIFETNQVPMGRWIIRCLADMSKAGATPSSSSMSGVYVNTITDLETATPSINIYAKYNSSVSYDVDGTYIAEVYAIDYPPNVSH